MARLFVDLYLDEDVHVLVARLIRARDFAALTAQEAGQLSVGDPAHLDFAARQGKTIVTHNRNDFQALHQHYVASGQHHAGIIIARRRRPYELARRLIELLNSVTADEMQDQIRYI